MLQALTDHLRNHSAAIALATYGSMAESNHADQWSDIALHLTLDLVRDCAVLGMMLRDRTEATNHHRTGGIGNEMVKSLPVVQSPYTAALLLTTIEACGEHLEALAVQWTATYTPRSHHLINHMRNVRSYLAIAG